MMILMHRVAHSLITNLALYIQFFLFLQLPLEHIANKLNVRAQNDKNLLLYSHWWLAMEGLGVVRQLRLIIGSKSGSFEIEDES